MVADKWIVFEISKIIILERFPWQFTSLTQLLNQLILRDDRGLAMQLIGILHFKVLIYKNGPVCPPHNCNLFTFSLIYLPLGNQFIKSKLIHNRPE